jgi:hypothetical protein
MLDAKSVLVGTCTTSPDLGTNHGIPGHNLRSTDWAIPRFARAVGRTEQGVHMRAIDAPGAAVQNANHHQGSKGQDG